MRCICLGGSLVSSFVVTGSPFSRICTEPPVIVLTLSFCLLNTSCSIPSLESTSNP